MEIEENNLSIEYKNDDGKYHREDGPAVYYKHTKTEYWFLNGKLHNPNGPAITYSTGTKLWYKHGKLHREDGPAVVTTDSQDYYLENMKYKNEESHKKMVKMLDIVKKNPGLVEIKHGELSWK